MRRRISSWMGGARRSSITVLKPVAYQPDPISGLPVELFYAVLDQVGDRDQRSRVLRSLSCASKALHQYVQHRLWQTFNISDALNRSLDPNTIVSDSRRRCLADSCNAITRALSRATYIWQLTITINSSSLRGFESSAASNRIMHALLSLPSLRVLNVHIISPSRQAAKSLASMMRKANFPFHLKAFSCHVSMEPDIFPFLAQQSSIEHYTVTSDKSPPSQKHAAAIDRSFRAISTSFLPRLCQYSGHTIYVQNLMWHRTLRYVSLFVHWQFFVPDVQASSRLDASVFDRSHLAHVSALNIEIDEFLPATHTPEFGKLAAGIYGMSPRFIERLRITTSRFWHTSVESSPAKTTSLSQFTQLKSLEVVWKDSDFSLWLSSGGEERIFSALKPLVQMAARACNTLRSVVFLLERGFFVFERVEGRSAHAPLTGSDEDLSLLFFGPDSTWSMWFSVKLPGWNDDPYPLQAPQQATRGSTF